MTAPRRYRRGDQSPGGEDVLKVCDELDVAVVGYSTLSGWPHGVGARADPFLRQLAARRGTDVPTLLARWLAATRRRRNLPPPTIEGGISTSRPRRRRLRGISTSRPRWRRDSHLRRTRAARQSRDRATRIEWSRTSRRSSVFQRSCCQRRSRRSTRSRTWWRRHGTGRRRSTSSGSERTAGRSSERLLPASLSAARL